MGRKTKKAKQAEIFAPDGRKILAATPFRTAIQKRAEERASKLIDEHDEQAAKKSLGSLPIRVTKLAIKASNPDYHGAVMKFLEIGAVVEFSKQNENLLSENMQELLVCDLKPKQIRMNLKRGRGKNIPWHEVPVEFKDAAKRAIGEDLDIKAALEDLCSCGHTRRDHFDYEDQEDSETPAIDFVSWNTTCRAEGCECEEFKPLAPGEKPKPVAGEEEDAAPGDMDVDAEVLCVCGHAKRQHDDLGDGFLTCAVVDCACECFKEQKAAAAGVGV